MAVNLTGFGYNESTDVTTTKTLALTDCGVVQNVTATTTITLPATVVGGCFIVRVGADSKTINVSPNAADKIAGNGFTATDDKDLIFTSQPIGSYVQLIGDGVNGWMIERLSGTATREA